MAKHITHKSTAEGKALTMTRKAQRHAKRVHREMDTRAIMAELNANPWTESARVETAELLNAQARWAKATGKDADANRKHIAKVIARRRKADAMWQNN